MPVLGWVFDPTKGKMGQSDASRVGHLRPRYFSPELGTPRSLCAAPGRACPGSLKHFRWEQASRGLGRGGGEPGAHGPRGQVGVRKGHGWQASTRALLCRAPLLPGKSVRRRETSQCGDCRLGLRPSTRLRWEMMSDETEGNALGARDAQRRIPEEEAISRAALHGAPAVCCDPRLPLGCTRTCICDPRVGEAVAKQRRN